MHNVALLSHTTQQLTSTTHPHSAFGTISDAKQLSASHYTMDREYLTLAAGPELLHFQLLNSSDLKEE
jgi:hypothetical protein